MSPVTQIKKLTAEDLWAMHPEDQAGRRYELEKGELIEMTPPGSRHGEIQVEIAYLIRRYLQQNPVGKALGGDAGFKLLEDCVRAPDVAFLSREKLLETPIPEEGYYPGAPDLAIEILSPGDTTGEVLRKVGRFLDAGTRLVWVVDPRRKNVTVYRPDEEILVLHEADVLTAGDVLPGFSCPVAELFPAPFRP